MLRVEAAGILVALEQVIGRIEIGRALDLAIRVGQQRADRRQEAARAAAHLVVLIITERGDLRVVAELQSRGRRGQQALRVLPLDLALGIAEQTGHAQR